MKRSAPNIVRVLSFLLLVPLAACFQVPRPVPLTPAPSRALLNDSDIDAARLDVLETLELLDVQSVRYVPEREVRTLPEAFLSAQTFFPDTDGFIAAIREQPQHVNPFHINIYNQANGAVSHIYAGQREIQSVAMSTDGNTLLFAMRETMQPDSFFQAYRLTLNPRSLTRLTATAHHKRDVSMSGDGSLLVWEATSPFSGRRGIFMRDYSQTPYVLTYLGTQNFDQTQPSVSGNGRYVAFTRPTVTGNIGLLVYDRLEQREQVMHISMFDAILNPSVADDGTVAWLQVRSTVNDFFIRLKTLSGTLTNAVHATAAAPIEHPFLTSDGLYLSYIISGTTTSFMRALDLQTMVTITTATSPLTNRNWGVYWAKAAATLASLYNPQALPVYGLNAFGLETPDLQPSELAQ